MSAHTSFHFVKEIKVVKNQRDSRMWLDILITDRDGEVHSLSIHPSAGDSLDISDQIIKARPEVPA